jgi:hypothetical protein
VIQWPQGWTIEDVVGWVIAANNAELFSLINQRLNRNFSSIAQLINSLKNGDPGGLKFYYVAHEEIAGLLKRSQVCVQRAEVIVETLTRAALGKHEGFAHLAIDRDRSTTTVIVYRVHL